MGQSDPDGAGRYEALVRRNPFMPAQSENVAPPVKTASTNNFRFTGFVKFGNIVRAGIENVPQGKSYLLAAGQSEDGVRIQDINLNDRYVMLVDGSETLRVDLQEERAGPPPLPVVSTIPTTDKPLPIAETPVEVPRRRIVVPKRT